MVDHEPFYSSANSSPDSEVSLAAIQPSAILLANADAVSPPNKDFWEPRIRKEEKSIREINKIELVSRQLGMDIIFCRYVFRVKKKLVPKVHRRQSIPPGARSGLKRNLCPGGITCCYAPLFFQ